MKSLMDRVRDYDEIVQPGYASFHFQTDTKQKTFLGGMLSLGVTLYLLYMVVSKGKQMLGLKEPYISSLEESMDYEGIGRVSLSQLNMPLFEVLQDGKYTVNLIAEDYERYVHIRLRNVVKTYPNGELNVTSHYYKIRPCTEADFSKTEYERNFYWHEIKNSRTQYCPFVPEGSPEPYMQGTRDNQYTKKEHAYWIYEIRKCTEEARMPLDPECAEPDAINQWLERKYATFKVINTKIDFTSFREPATRQYELLVPNVPISSGKYCDTGGRFRMNKFERTDHWLSLTTTVNPFYDYVFFNSDCYDVDPREDLIAELFYRLSVDQITHTRIVLSFMDFIGTLGGVSEVLIKIIGLAFGGYAMFHSRFQTISELYQLKSTTKTRQLFQENEQGESDKLHMERMNLSLWTRLRMFLTSQFMLAPLLRCLKTKRIEQFNDLMREGSEMFEREMNIFFLLRNQRRLLSEWKRTSLLQQPEEDDMNRSLMPILDEPEPIFANFKTTDSIHQEEAEKAQESHVLPHSSQSNSAGARGGAALPGGDTQDNTNVIENDSKMNPLDPLDGSRSDIKFGQALQRKSREKSIRISKGESNVEIMITDIEKSEAKIGDMDKESLFPSSLMTIEALQIQNQESQELPHRKAARRQGNRSGLNGSEIEKRRPKSKGKTQKKRSKKKKADPEIDLGPWQLETQDALNPQQ